MKRIAALVLFACLTAKAHAIDPFVASDIRIDGLQRIAPGTVFTYLPVEKGDNVTTERAQQAVRALYKTGFFTDVQIGRQGNILVITVKERPAISKIQIKGNKDLKEEDLLKGLKDIGLAEGEPFDRLSLDRVTQELTRQYYNRGKYNVTIKPTVINLDRNRIELAINIAEGKVAKIKSIELVGNKTYPTGEIRSDFESDTSNWTSWYSRDDQYSKEKLTGDLEKLQSFYLDRGYLDYSLDSTEVSISPDKRDMYLTASMTEGQVYKISDIQLSGTLVVSEDEMRKFIDFRPGEVFSRQKVQKASEQMTAVLANIGYAFAQVTPIPTPDKEKLTVGINFFVNPGKRVYVRRIEFAGNGRTEDEVMRREMRQLEGAWYSQAAIDRSKIRLQRLGYFKKVDISTPRVPGTDDQIDIRVKVEETNSGSFTFGVGYSQLDKLILSVAVSENNFLGSGDQAGISASKSYYQTSYGLNYYQPYLTDSGIGLGYTLRYTKSDFGNANIANFTNDTASFAVNTGIPIGENDAISLSLGASKTKIKTFYDSYLCVKGANGQCLVDANGNQILQTDPNGNNLLYRQYWSPAPIVDYLNAIGHYTFHQFTLSAGWTHDTRNKYFNPTHGSIQSLGIEVALPGSTAEYWKINYRYQQYIPVTHGFVLEGTVNVGYGDAYGKNSKLGLPFFENYYAGGVSDVRNFRDNTLGTNYQLDKNGNPIPGTGNRYYLPNCGNSDYCLQPLGGAFKTTGSLELIIPMPFIKDDSATRLSWYVDVGNVYRNFSDFSWTGTNGMRASTGLSLHWQAPVGPIVINLGRPIIKKPGDISETLQFNFGGTF
ncbi:MAG: outer membrane protein assembly factor BamA [Rudaea sp.]|nr:MULTISPECIES: outer membrane protein assembly factor BamA [unclassified Rudaea]MBN8886629.1 outer membrane protein assembly factor BamA [Rudaea sp.]